MGVRRDHPRSRGVYGDVSGQYSSGDGSSPLARGLRTSAGRPGFSTRIIPARAGFTMINDPNRVCATDHPRSRGVYLRTLLPCRARCGSSPLARGLPAKLKPNHIPCRIIPARAGFTILRFQGGKNIRDHPRSRGVYTCGSLESQRRATLPDCVCLHCRPSARSAEFR